MTSDEQLGRYADSFVEVLTEVRDGGPETVTEIARNTGLSESTVRRVLTRLEERGLIESETYQLKARTYFTP